MCIFQVKVTRKIFAYTWSNFWTDLGGNSGLWLGLSVFGMADNLADIFKYVKRKKNQVMNYLHNKKVAVKEAVKNSEKFKKLDGL